jgi:transposase
VMGISPVKEIARRKRVSENTVHQWVHRARKLDFLEPSTRSQSRKEGAA